MDIDEQLLARAREKTPPERSVGVIFFCDVLHHIANRPPSYRQVTGELQNAGFALKERLDTLPYQYFLFFERR